MRNITIGRVVSASHSDRSWHGVTLHRGKKQDIGDVHKRCSYLKSTSCAAAQCALLSPGMTLTPTCACNVLLHVLLRRSQPENGQRLQLSFNRKSTYGSEKPPLPPLRTCGQAVLPPSCRISAVMPDHVSYAAWLRHQAACGNSAITPKQHHGV